MLDRPVTLGATSARADVWREEASFSSEDKTTKNLSRIERVFRVHVSIVILVNVFHHKPSPRFWCSSISDVSKQKKLQQWGSPSCWSQPLDTSTNCFSCQRAHGRLRERKKLPKLFEKITPLFLTHIPVQCSPFDCAHASQKPGPHWTCIWLLVKPNMSVNPTKNVHSQRIPNRNSFAVRLCKGVRRAK